MKVCLYCTDPYEGRGPYCSAVCEQADRGLQLSRVDEDAPESEDVSYGYGPPADR